MPGNIAGEIKKKYGEIDFINPIIIFKYQRIDLNTRMNNFDYLSISAIFFVQLLFLLLERSQPLWHLMMFVVSLFLIYRISSGSNKVEIDFFYKRIKIKSHFILVHFIRTILNVPETIHFSEVKSIFSSQGVYYGHGQTRSFLAVKTIRFHSIRLVRFASENHSRKFAELLEAHIVGQPELNK